MNNATRIGFAVALIVLAASVCAPVAHAVKITNVTQATTLFNSLGFETETVGMDALNANPGNWSNTGQGQDVVLTGGVPGAHEGANYLSTTRDFSGIVGNPRAFFAPQNTPGDELHAEWMMWLPNSEDIALLFDDNSVGGFQTILMRIGQQAVEANLEWYDGVVWNSMTPALNATKEIWQKWELDYTIGANDFTITVDGTSATGTITNPLAAAPDHLSFGHNGLQTYFLDGVPGSGLLLGDANNDGTVTADDLIAVQQNFGNVGPNGDGTDLGDANDDGTVTADDLIAVQQNFGNTLGAAGAAVPEPGTLALIAAVFGAAGLARRRERSNHEPRSR